MHAPQILWLIFVAVTLVSGLVRAGGRPAAKAERASLVIATLMLVALYLLVPAWGGFFK